MKISKATLKQIIKEELDAMQEYGKNSAQDAMASYMDAAAGLRPEEGPQADRTLAYGQPEQPEKKEDPLSRRVQDIITKIAPAEPLLKTIDDPKEVIQLLVAMVDHIRGLNPDLSPAELQRTIDLLRTNVLPKMRKGIK